MKYRINAARLIVSTYGQKFTPAMRGPAHVLASNLQESAYIQGKLDQLRASWKSPDMPTAAAALSAARDAITEDLTAGAAGVVYTVVAQPDTYRPIFDENHKQIGHDTVAWVMKDGQPLSAEFDASGQLLQPGTTPMDQCIGMVACIALSVGAETDAAHQSMEVA